MKSIVISVKPLRPLRLPFAHFKILQGLAYNLMSYDSALSAEVHDRRFAGKKAFKFFCFTDLMGRYYLGKDELIYKNSFEWELRSADDRIIEAAEQKIKHDSVLTFNNQPCRVLSYKKCEKRFCANSINLKMNTPIVVYHTEPSGFVRYYNPFEGEFVERVSKNIQNKYEMFFGKPLADSVAVECIAPSDGDKCVTHYEDSIITAWYGKYRVTAPPEVLDFIWHTGLGSKNSMGFGTVSEL